MDNSIEEEPAWETDGGGQPYTVDASSMMDAALAEAGKRAAGLTADSAPQSQQAASSQPSAVHPLAGGNASRPMPLHESSANVTLSLPLSSLSSPASPLSGIPTPSPAVPEGDDVLLSPTAASTGASMPLPSLYSLLGILNALRSRVACKTLDHLFAKINLDARTWGLLLRSQLPPNESKPLVEQLNDTLTEFVKRLNRKSSTLVPSLLSNVLYTEEVNFAFRVYSRSSSLAQALFRSLKPLFLEIENYLESSERTAMPVWDFKELYAANEEKRKEIDAIFAALDSPQEDEDETEARDKTSSASSRCDSAQSSNRSSIASPSPSMSGGRRSIAAGLANFVVRSRGSSRRGSRKPGVSFDGLGTPSRIHSRRPSDSGGSATPNFASGWAAPSSSSSTTQQGRMSKDGLSTPVAAASSGTPMPQTPAESVGGATPLAAASSPVTAADAPHGEDGSDSEEETELDLGAGEDIFSKLLATSSSHCYPLPPKARKIGSGGTGNSDASPPAPSSDFLRSYTRVHSHAFRLVEVVLDTYTCSLLAQLTALAIGEILGQSSLYSSCQADANALASHLVRIGLPLMGKLLAIEPGFMEDNILALSFRGVERGAVYADARQVVRKVRMLHALFASLDIFLFPRTVNDAHAGKAGVKCVSPAAADPFLLLTGGYDRALRIWDLRLGAPGVGGSSSGGRCLAQFIGHKSVVTWCSFASCSNDTWLASTSLDGTARLWNSRSGECTRVMEGHTDGILCAALGARDAWLVTGSMDCTLRLWSTRHSGHGPGNGNNNGNCVRIFRGHRHWIKAVAFAPDSQSLISAGLDHTIFIWPMRGAGGGGAAAGAMNAGALGTPRHVIVAHAGPVLDLLPLSAERFVSASKDRSLRVWDVASGKEDVTCSPLANAANSTPLSLALSPDGRNIAVAFFDHTINVYEARGPVENEQGSTGKQEGNKSSAHMSTTAGAKQSSRSDSSSTAGSQNGAAASSPPTAVPAAPVRARGDLLRTIKVHNDGILCVRWLTSTTLVVGTATGKIQVVHL